MPVSKIKTFVAKQYNRLLQIRDTPHAIAGGVAIGTGLGFTPLLGFKTLLAVLIAWWARCSKLSAVLAVTFHDILLPVWPFVLRWQYIIGFWILHHHLPARMTRDKFVIENWLHWKTLQSVWPLLIGSLVMAIPVAAICYPVALQIVTRYQRSRDEEITSI